VAQNGKIPVIFVELVRPKTIEAKSGVAAGGAARMLAFGNDGATEPGTEIVGKLEQLLVAVDLDRHFSGIAKQL
jgi:hypothetical protein